MELGHRIAELRKNNKISQSLFAKQYHVTQQTVSSWEHGKSYPDLETLIHISEDYSVSLDDLIKDDRRLVKAIDMSKNQAERARNAFRTAVGVVILLTIVLIVAIDWSVKPTADENRSINEGNIRMMVCLPHMNPSRAISYTTHGSISDERIYKKIEKWSNAVLGKTADDIPDAYPGDYIRLHFQDPYYNDMFATEIKSCMLKLKDAGAERTFDLTDRAEIENGDIVISPAAFEVITLEVDNFYECTIAVGYMIGKDEYTSITGVKLQSGR